MPESKEGTSTTDNLAFACGGCNAYKSDCIEGVDPLSGLPARLFHPRQDCWSDHFPWDSDLVSVIGLTDIGRATLHVLKINRPNVRNLRKLLLKEGEHPPEDEG